MKIGLISGHGGRDRGAQGFGYAEADLTIELTKIETDKLRALGHEVVVYPYERDAYTDLINGAFQNIFNGCHYVIENHFNAVVQDWDGDGKTTGSEIYVTTSEEGITVEEEILKNLASLGFRNRGVKRYNWAVISKIKQLGISSALVENCFIDDKDDMDLYLANKNKFADAVVKGILDGFGVVSAPDQKPQPQPKPTPSPQPSQTKIDSAKSLDKNLAKAYACTDNLNLRVGAGTNKTIITTMPKGTRVVCHGYYTAINNVKWLCVTTSINDKSYTGYCSMEYLA